MVDIFSVAFAVRTASKSTSNPIQLSHAQQLAAAALGYKSLAAFQASPLEAPTLDDAAHFVLDGGLLADRARDLGLPHQIPQLAVLLQQAFAERLPGAHLHQSEGDLHNYITSLVDDVALNDDAVSGEMASTNGDSIDEVYIPVDDIELASLPPLGELLEMELEGHIAMGIDTERPYSGHKIEVQVHLAIERTGKVSIAEPVCEVVSAQLDWSWGADDEDGPPKVSLAQALADETGLTVAEAEELTDAEALPNESDDGMVYGYVFDFNGYATPSTAAKLEAKYGSLHVEVSPSFFEQVAHTF